MQINIEKRHLFIILAFMVFLAGVILVVAYSSIPNPGHSGDTIWVNTKTGEKTLQQAIDDGDFGGGENDVSGTLCGLHMRDGSEYTFNCQEHNPRDSCPAGYTRRCGAVSSPDRTCVCVKN